VTLNIGSRPKGRRHRKDDAAGLQAGRAYDKGIRDFEKPGRVERAAKEAQQALEGPEGMSSSGHRKPRDARAKAMMLAVARRSSDLAEDIRGTRFGGKFLVGLLVKGYRGFEGKLRRENR
jgi:hypothetical protein